MEQERPQRTIEGNLPENPHRHDLPGGNIGCFIKASLQAKPVFN